MITWAHPENWKWLWAVLAFFIALVWFEMRKRDLVKRFGEQKLVQELSSSLNPGKRRLKQNLLLLALVCLVAALVQPQLPGKAVFVKKTGLDLVIAVDVSQSMLAEDILPNRLEKAKLELQDFVEKAQGDRIGIVAFAGEAYAQLPLTLDRSAAKLFIKSLSPNLIPLPGTALGQAVRVSSELFVDSKDGTKVIVLLTDGEDQDSDPLGAAKAAAKRGIKVYTIGLGTPKGEVIPLRDAGKSVRFKQDLYGKTVVSKLDETTLQTIARETGGAYYRSQKGNFEVDRIYEDIRKLTQQETGSGWVMEQEPLYRYPLLAAILLLLLEWVLSERRPTARERDQKRDPMPSAALVMMLVLSPMAMGVSGKAADRNRQANEFYGKGQFQEAKKLYEEAKAIEPEAPQIQYNLANTTHQLKDHKTAEKQYQAALKTADRSLKAPVYYNLGNTYVRLNKIDEAIKQYKDALRLNPQDQDAKYNLEFVMKKKNEQNQKLNQQEQQKQQNQQNQQNQDQNQDQQGEGEQQQQKDSQQSQNQQNQDQKEGQDRSQDQKEGEGSESEQQQNPQNQQGKGQQGQQKPEKGGGSEQKQPQGQSGEKEEKQDQQKQNQGMGDRESESGRQDEKPQSGQGEGKSDQQEEGEGEERQQPQGGIGETEADQQPKPSAEQQQYGRILDALGNEEAQIMQSRTKGMPRSPIVRDKDW